MGYTKPIGDLELGSSGATTRNQEPFWLEISMENASVTEEGSKAFQVLFAAAVFRMSEPMNGNERIQFSTNEIPGDRPPNQTNDKISPMSHDRKSTYGFGDLAPIGFESNSNVHTIRMSQEFDTVNS